MSLTHTLLILGGIYHLFFGFFHVKFWTFAFLNWQQELPRMTPMNRAVMQMLNVAVIIFMFLIAYISLRYTNELLTPGLGQSMLWGVVIFWTARLAGEFTLKDGAPSNPKLVAALSSGILLYLLPAILL